MNPKRIRLIVVIIAIIAIIGIIVKLASPKKQEEKPNYADKQENGTVVNTSKKLSETKTYKGLEFTNIKFSHTESVTSLNAQVKNTTTNKIPAQLVDINVLDKDGNVMTSFVGEINELEPGETTTIDSGIAANYVNAYDIEFVSPVKK